MAVLAAAVFPLLATTAHADVMAAGTYSGHITGGTLTLGNGKFHDLAVPAGEAFSFTIPAGASAPVAWTAPATHVELPLQTEVDSSGTVRTAGGSLDISIARDRRSGDRRDARRRVRARRAAPDELAAGLLAVLLHRRAPVRAERAAAAAPR